MISNKFVFTLVGVLSFAVLAHADYINGVVWSVPAATASATPTLGNTPGPGATKLATFTANGINFSGDGSGAYSIGGFLNSGGAASNIVYLNGASASTNLDNTLWEFTGSTNFTNGNTFNVAHDDGVNMYVNGVAVLLAPDPTGPTINSFTYTGATGVFNFDFIYTECCGGQADFITTIVPSGPTTSNGPEPATGFLVFGALGLLAGGLRFKRFLNS